MRWLSISRALLPGISALALFPISQAAAQPAAIEAAASQLAPPPSREALDRIPDQGRKLLALRSYLRGSAGLAARWSWTTAEIEAFEGTANQKRLLDAISAVADNFAAANPGFQLYANTKVRSLDEQIAQWNENQSVGIAAAELMVAFWQRFPATNEPALIDTQSLAAWLKSIALTNRANLAAPGLSRHGQARAIDFQVMQGTELIAGTDSHEIEAVWKNGGWEAKLSASVEAAGPSFHGPLKSPVEPWHYDYSAVDE